MRTKYPKNPILLFGLPRSGTSWLAKIFDSHPDIFYLHEPDKTIRARNLQDCMTHPLSSDELSRLLDHVNVWMNCTKSSVVASRPVFRKNFDNIFMQLYRPSMYFAGKLIERVGKDISIPAVGGANRSGARIAWKSINSSGRLGALAEHLPESHGILILRHPCGEIGSVLRNERQNPSIKSPASQDMGIYDALSKTIAGRKFGFSVDMASKLSAEERLAWRWKILSDHAVGEVEKIENVKIVSYDAACSNPLEASKELFAFCNLSWSEQTEEFIRSSTQPDREDPSYFSLSKDPLKSANKWKDELSEGEIKNILAVLEDSKAFRYCSEAT